MWQDFNQKTFPENQATQFHMPTGAGRKHGGAQQGRRGPETNEEHLLA